MFIVQPIMVNDIIKICKESIEASENVKHSEENLDI